MSNQNLISGQKLLHKIFGLSVYEIHNRTGIPYQQLIRWNNGVSKLDLAMLEKLCSALQMRPGEFVDNYLEYLKEMN